jgi:hypothetical protein
VDLEITYFVLYPCPHCQAELEAQHRGWQGWLRCPSCGVPSLPPEFLLGHPRTQRRVQGADADQGAIATAAATESLPEPDRAQVGGSSSPISALRLIFLTGFILSLFLLLIAYLDHNGQTATTFGFLSIAFLLLLLRSPGSRRTRQE